MSHKQVGNEFIFDTFCDLLIKEQLKLVEEGKLGGKNQAHLLKSEVKTTFKERGWKDQQP